MTRSKPCYFPLISNVICFFFGQSLYSATFIHSQFIMIKITFCSLSFQSTLTSLILVSFWFILPYSVVIPPRSGIFRYHICLFRLIPVSFRLIPAYPGLFRNIPFRSVPFPCLVTPFHDTHLPSPSVSDKRLSGENPAVTLKIFSSVFTMASMILTKYSTEEDVIEFLTEIWWKHSKVRRFANHPKQCLS